eukprot:364586-Chlamydomonas_euryale.AAC.24
MQTLLTCSGWSRSETIPVNARPRGWGHEHILMCTCLRLSAICPNLTTCGLDVLASTAAATCGS